MKILRIAAVCVASASLMGCPSTSVRQPKIPTAVPAGAPDVRGATIYAVDSKASDVQIHVFRGGTLARLGHNHVMTSKHVSGRIWSHDSIERSGFELTFPVAQLIVDDPQARTAAGSAFPGEISAGDREGTRKNMLRAEVLDADRHPTIGLRSVGVSGSLREPQITTRITIKGVSRNVLVPAMVTIEGNRLLASGEFDIQQTSFGIEPFSIGLGALQVQDRVHVRFRIIARR